MQKRNEQIIRFEYENAIMIFHRSSKEIYWRQDFAKITSIYEWVDSDVKTNIKSVEEIFDAYYVNGNRNVKITANFNIDEYFQRAMLKCLL